VLPPDANSGFPYKGTVTVVSEMGGRVEGREEAVRLLEEPDGAAGWLGGPWWALVAGRGLVASLEVGWGCLVVAVVFGVACGALVF
jgi:hypothetical protein